MDWKDLTILTLTPIPLSYLPVTTQPQQSERCSVSFDLIFGSQLIFCSLYCFLENPH